MADLLSSFSSSKQVKNEWVTEIVRDVNVINAYVRKRQLIEEKEIAAEAVMPTGDAERDKRMKKLFVDHFSSLLPLYSRISRLVLSLRFAADCSRRLKSSRRTRVDVSTGRRLSLGTRTESSSLLLL